MQFLAQNFIRITRKTFPKEIKDKGHQKPTAFRPYVVNTNNNKSTKHNLHAKNPVSSAQQQVSSA